MAEQHGAYSTLPEVAYTFRESDSLPQVRHDDGEKIVVTTTPPQVKEDIVPEFAETAVNRDPLNNHTDDTPLQPQPNWFRRQRKRVLLGISLLILAIIAGIIAGVVVSTSRSSSAPSETPLPTNPSDASDPTHAFGTPITFSSSSSLPSTCTGTICPHLLATASFSTPPTTFLFARGSDSAIWYRTATNNTWTTPWTSLNGSFISPPTAASMRDGHIDVFAISSEDQSARFKTFQNAVWDTEWTSLGGRSSSVASVCSLASHSLHTVTLDDTNGVYHKWADGGGVWKPALVNRWEKFGGYAASTVDMGCAEGRVDLVAYGRESEGGYGMTVKRGNGTVWTGWEGAMGRFRGDPTVLVGLESSEFLGVGEDGGVRWREWKAGQGEVVGGEIDLGGKFMSTVAGVWTGEERVDIFAVGTDARLWHKARIGRTWGTEWENLGGHFNSAPRVTVTREGEIAVFGLGPNGTVIHALIEIGTEYNWGDRQWFSDGGEMTAKWFRLGPA